MLCYMSYQNNHRKKIIKKLKTVLKERLKLIDDQTIERSRKIHSRHIISTLYSMIINHCGYQEAVTDLKIKGLIEKNISYQAINKKILSGKFSKQLYDLNQELIKIFFKSDHRNYAVDGSKINLSHSLITKGFKVIGKRYCTGSSNHNL